MTIGVRTAVLATPAPLVIPGVNERDIDLLLLEEFHASAAFGRWFLQHLNAVADVADIAFVEARRSVTQVNGESDVEADFRLGDGRRLRVLIENKVGAGLQPQQAERYVVRGQSYCASAECDLVITVIMAPARYFPDASATIGFDRRLDYEALLDWFEGADELGTRRRYKCALLRSAIDKGTLGYQPVADDVVTSFWRDYWLMARELAPELEMPEPTNKPGRSGFIRMRAPIFGQLGLQLVHKVKKGKVDLQFPGRGRALNDLQLRLGSMLEEDMSIERASDSGAVRIVVPVLSTVESMATQQPDARTGILAAQRLLRWAISNAAVLATVVNRAQARTAP